MNTIQTQTLIINAVAFLTGHSAEQVAIEWCLMFAKEWREAQ